ncbi:hypothetical protein E4U17_001269 [Claviceps sp. LM77 group G4]|nr:hypothetical protein E4U17_001269 [Claviceps sp. LM77 group G4]KAG6085724.1 hypothetical protein E4U16_002097 [Claviceps sp. LM84 group G4]KAG6086164.1 hypothetical protein E4U33_007810 [Claviceps sp. LM78 group G4]
MSVQGPVSPGSIAESPMSPESTSSKNSRRSLIMMASNLKPTRQRLQKYFAKSRHSAPEPVLRQWSARNLGSGIKMASLQMASLGNPEVPISPVVKDSRHTTTLVRVDTEQQRKHKPVSTPEIDMSNLESVILSPSVDQAPPSSAREDSAPSTSSPSLASAAASAEASGPSQSQRSPSPSPPVAEAQGSAKSALLPSPVSAAASAEASVPSSSQLSPSPSPSASETKHSVQPPSSPLTSTVAPVEASVPTPSRPSPPPPPPSSQTAARPLISDVMSMETDPTKPRMRRGPSLIKPRPRSSVRRRAKTPVHNIGHLEMAAAKKKQEAAIAVVDRQCSVRTMVRQYRTLVDDTLLTEDTNVPPVPDVPPAHREPLSATVAPEPAPQVQEFDDNYGPIPKHSGADLRRGAGLFEAPRPRNELAPSPIASDADTLVSFHDEAAYLTPLLFPSPPSSPRLEKARLNNNSNDGRIADEDADTAKSSGPDGARFEIAFDLLTRELSAAFADSSARSASDTSGLQVWVMIAAYERLRDQISAMESPDPKLQGAKAMFDTWLDALRSVQKAVAGEGAESGSEYGDE